MIINKPYVKNVIFNVLAAKTHLPIVFIVAETESTHPNVPVHLPHMKTTVNVKNARINVTLVPELQQIVKVVPKIV